MKRPPAHEDNKHSYWTDHSELTDAIATHRSDEDYKDYKAAADRIVKSCPNYVVKIAARLYIEGALRDLDRAGTREIERMAQRAAKVKAAEKRRIDTYRKKLEAEQRAPERRERSESPATVMMRRAMQDLADAFEALEWRNELLASRFTLNDGTSVSWGEATVEQHQERIEMFLANAAANTEGAARHKKAVDDILANNVSRLGEIPGIGVAA